MRLLDRVRIVGKKHNGKEGVLTGINNNTASVVIRLEVGNKLYGYIRIEVSINDIQSI